MKFIRKFLIMGSQKFIQIEIVLNIIHEDEYFFNSKKRKKKEKLCT